MADSDDGGCGCILFVLLLILCCVMMRSCAEDAGRHAAREEIRAWQVEARPAEKSDDEH